MATPKKTSKSKNNKTYMNNPNLPTRGHEFEYSDEMILEIAKCKTDILHFAQNYFYILTTDEGRKTIELYDSQRKVLEDLRDNRFNILLSSRQSGKSTLATIYTLWLANFFPDQRILLVANKEATAVEIFSRIRMAYEMLPNWLKSPIDGSYGKTSMELENGSRISISTTTGTAARGQSASFLIIDECAFIENHLLDPFWASIFPIISASKKAKIFICSTPNGTGNLFHTLYSESQEGKNNWHSNVILWSDIPGRDEKWAKDIKSGLASEEKWRQEFECSFLNTGTSSMNIELYRELRKGLMQPVEILMDGKYKIFSHPNPERIYVAGVDCSDGVGGDYSVIKILDITDPTQIEEVAEYYDNTISILDFSNKVYEILQHWGNPLVCIERNNQGGQVVDRLAHDFAYPKVVNWGCKMAQRKTQLLGMISQRTTKYHAVINARYFYNEKGQVIFRNEDSLEEIFKDFIKIDEQKWAAASGKHDDRTMALVWALMVLDKELVDKYFEVEETDDCGKPKVIRPMDFGLEYFENPTSIYTNEVIHNIEGSRLCPVSFGSGSEFDDEMADLMLDGWSLLQPYSNSHINKKQSMTQEQYDIVDKWF